MQEDERVGIYTTAVRLGIRRVRLTGGEPLVRQDILEIAARIKSLPGVEDLALSTNGTELARLAPELVRAGVDRVNVSLDSLDAEVFRAITRRGGLDEVWRGVEAALDAGLHPVKLNAVLLQENLADVERLTALTLDRPLAVRFIEMMPTASNQHLQPESFVSADLARRLEADLARWREELFVVMTRNAADAADFLALRSALTPMLEAGMRAYTRIVKQDFGMCLIRIGEDPLPEAEIAAAIRDMLPLAGAAARARARRSRRRQCHRRDHRQRCDCDRPAAHSRCRHDRQRGRGLGRGRWHRRRELH